MVTLTVFCGASSGNSPAFLAVAQQVGRAFAQANCTLVYGGGQLGLMGAVSEACLLAGGSIHGVIPSAFLKKTTSPPDDRLHAAAGGHTESFPIGERSLQTEVKSMHDRKKIMADLSDGFVALPGGFGTLEEVFEMTTWTQLGIHKKPVVLLNVDGFFSPLRDFVEGAIKSGFISTANRAFLVFVDRPLDAGDEFNWGEAALTATSEWIAMGAGGGVQYALSWGEGEKVDLR